MKIAVAQVDTTVGDFAGNAQRIRKAVDAARSAGASLVVAPELALSGYPPEDLLLRDDFLDACRDELMRLATWCLDVALVLGHPHREGRTRYNAASLLRNGRIEAMYFKQRLAGYAPFDEQRYFTAGEGACVFAHAGRRIALAIGDDLWSAQPAAQAKAAGAELLLGLHAAPFHRAKLAERYQVLGARVKETKLPLLCVRGVGGQDELVFDGASFALDAQGMITYQADTFREAVDIVEFEASAVKGPLARPLTEEELVYRALVMGLADYVGKNGFPGAVLGLSGGIDSALVLAICVDALGAERVHAVMMPSAYTAAMSVEDAREMARITGVRYSEIPIATLFDGFRARLASALPEGPVSTAEENLQSRIRGTLLMALSNKSGAIVVTAGNKSELATGYATLHGDTSGGFAVIKDIVKTLVYRLARWRNTRGQLIPERVIDRAPSAELRPGQVDQETLPPYEVVDAVVERFMDRDMTPEQIAGTGYDTRAVEQVVRFIRNNEYKRRQAPPGVRITPRASGKEWRFPITSGFRPKS